MTQPKFFDSAKFITFEGGEGAGKSTQAMRLQSQLERAGFEVVVTREPGGSAFAEQVRRLILDAETAAHGPLAEALLFSAARADHIRTTIRPALARGAWVLCDRFTDSTRVYQGKVYSQSETGGGHATDDPPRVSDAVLRQLEAMTVEDTTPDLTFILDVPAKVGLARVGQRSVANKSDQDRYETRGLAFHTRLRAGFLAVAKAEPDRCVVVDGAACADGIAAEIWGVVRDRFGVGAR